MVLQDKSINGIEHVQNDWTLTADQITFMLQHHNFIETAYSEDNSAALRELALSEEYTTLFGEMGWDEAYDRYESLLDEME